MDNRQENNNEEIKEQIKEEIKEEGTVKQPAESNLSEENGVPEGSEAADAEMACEAEPVPKKTTVAEDIFDLFECFVFSLVTVFIVFAFITRICVVDGQSMENTLFDSEKLIVSELSGEPERGDIIVFHQTGAYFNEPLVKRVIAVGGEYIDIRADEASNRLVVTIYDSNMENPQVLEEDYAAYKDSLMISTSKTYPVQVPEGYLFVMGDNRNHSTDSRSALVDFVDSRRVLGTVLIRISPLSRFGTVD